jgi:hypothetical protein
MLALCLSLCAGAAMADHFGLYTDVAGTNCLLGPSLAFPPTLNNVYVIHKLNHGSQAAQFKVQDGSGLFLSSANVTAPYLLIGTLTGGASIAYTSCVVGDHVVATLGYFFFGTPVTCGKVEVIPDPAHATPVIVAVDCNFNEVPSTGGTLYVSTTGAPGQCGGCNEPNATESRTWGTIKALYR